MPTGSLSATVAALYATAQTIYADSVSADGSPVSVTYGNPGQYQANAIVAVAMEVRSPITRPTAGTNRSRSRLAEIDTVISVYQPGDETVQQAANEKAWELEALLETYFRTVAPNEALGGACLDAYVSDSRLVPSIAYQAMDDPTSTPVATGRIAEIVATVTALIRY